MLFIVQPCFHWVGYHIVTHLLQEGIEVVGIDELSEEVNTHLYMLVGRNSNFQHFFFIEDKSNHLHGSNEETFISYQQNQLVINRENEVEVIDLPPLYGEWMDLNKFHSESALYQWVKETNALYIKVVVKKLIDRLIQKEEVSCLFPLDIEESEESMKQNVNDIWETYMKSKFLVKRI